MENKEQQNENIMKEDNKEENMENKQQMEEGILEDVTEDKKPDSVEIIQEEECMAEETEQTEETNEENASEEKVEEAEQTVEEKKGFFKKKKDKKDQQIEELTDQYKRTMAEFDNFRKRTEKEKTQMYEIGARDIIEKILPIVDNFERGLSVVSEEEKNTPFVEGIDKVYKQLLTTLEEIGVKVIEAEGCEFDPNLHNAVMHVEDENLKENVIAEVFQKGYIYKENVVRYSMVKVAN